MKKVLLVIVVLALIVVAFPLTRTSNCGGNSAALASTRTIAISCFRDLAESRGEEVLLMEEWLAEPENQSLIDHR